MKSRVARIVTSYFEQSGGQGMTRAELAKAIGWKQTRNLPGVRAAIEEHLICYDGSPEGRLIPWDSYQDTRDS